MFWTLNNRSNTCPQWTPHLALFSTSWAPADYAWHQLTMHSAWHQQTIPGTSWLFRAHTDYAGHQLIIPCTYLLTMPGTSWLCIAQQQGSQSSADQLWNVMVGIHNSRLIKVFTGAKNFVKVFLLKNLPDCWSLPSLSLPARPDCIHECIHGFFIFVCVSIPPGVRNAYRTSIWNGK